MSITCLLLACILGCFSVSAISQLSADPNNGPNAGGNVVIVRNAVPWASMDISTVLLGGSRAEIVSVSADTVVVIAGPAAIPVLSTTDIVVQGNGFSENGGLYTYNAGT